MAIFAFADTVSSVVSNLLGAGKGKEDVWKVCKKAILQTYSIGIPFLLVSALFPSTLLQVYTNNTDLIEAALPTMYIMLIGYFLSPPGLILFNAVSGTGNTNKSMKLWRLRCRYISYM